MLCGDVKKVVYFFLDGSLASEKKEDVQSHLNLCPDCERRADIHRRMRDFVKRKLTVDSAPARLRSRLERSIRAFRAEWQQ